jgi:hypothetical protein
VERDSTGRPAREWLQRSRPKLARMQPEPVYMHRKSRYLSAPIPARAPLVGLADAWPFADPARKLSPEIRQAALRVLRTTARDWSLAASR